MIYGLFSINNFLISSLFGAFETASSADLASWKFRQANLGFPVLPYRLMGASLTKIDVISPN